MGAVVVSGLFVYPVKSLRARVVSSAIVGLRGFEGDRRFVVTRPNGTFVTQRTCPALATVDAELDGGSLVLRVNGREPLRVSIADDGAPLRVTIWNDIVDARDQGNLAAEWLSAIVGDDVRLARMPESTLRPVERPYAREGDVVSFADAYPFLVVGEASLDDLNARLATPVPMNRFRPSIVLRGGGPYEEDEWTSIRIGDVRFHLVKPCARCVVTTTDQVTGERGVEPLRTLATYRTFGGKVMFAQNAVHDGRGPIHVGDEVVVEGRRPPLAP